MSAHPILTDNERTSLPSAESGDTLRLLRSALLLVVAAVLLLTGTVFIYLYREVILIRRQSGELARVVLDYEKTAWPQMQSFKQNLQNFSKTNPDFTPILGKFFGTNETARPTLNELPNPRRSSGG